MKLFLGNLSFDLDEHELSEAIYTQTGLVATNPRVVRDKETGKPRGFGFVEIDDTDALSAVDGIELAGRPVRAEMAAKQPEDKPRGKGRRNAPRSAAEARKDGKPRRKSRQSRPSW